MRFSRPAAAGLLTLSLLAAAVVAPVSAGAQTAELPLTTWVGPLRADASRADVGVPPLSFPSASRGAVRSTPGGWAGEPPPIPRQESVAHPAAAMSASLLVPGLGQHLLGQRRRWIYAGVEALGWVFYAERRGAGGEYRDRYQDLAWNEARARVWAGPRVDGGFPYYETLTQWERSGAFDADAGLPGLQPETDPATFNGSIWQRAAGLFLPGGQGVPVTAPGYIRALEYYSGLAYGPDFLWDWAGTGDAQRRFGDLIHDSDERFRQATNLLGAVLANHVISAVDAYLSARGLGARLDLRVDPLTASGVTRWSGRLSVRAPG